MVDIKKFALLLVVCFTLLHASPTLIPWGKVQRDCAHECNCTGVIGDIQVECRHWKRIPPSMPEHTTSLLLYDSHLTRLTAEMFSYADFSDLKYLDLSNVSLNDIEQNAFIGMKNLKTFWLNDNDLSTEVIQQLNIHKKRRVSLRNNPRLDCGKVTKLYINAICDNEYTSKKPNISAETSFTKKNTEIVNQNSTPCTSNETSSYNASLPASTPESQERLEVLQEKMVVDGGNTVFIWIIIIFMICALLGGSIFTYFRLQSCKANVKTADVEEAELKTLNNDGYSRVSRNGAMTEDKMLSEI